MVFYNVNYILTLHYCTVLSSEDVQTDREDIHNCIPSLPVKKSHRYSLAGSKDVDQIFAINSMPEKYLGI